MTLLLHLFVVWHASKNGYQKYVYLTLIGSPTQNMIAILGSIINIIGGGGEGLYDHLVSMKNVNFMMNNMYSYELKIA